MFVYLLLGVSVAAAIHIAILEPCTVGRAGTAALLWLLVGYCGIPMVGVSVATLASPELVAGHLGFAAGHPFQDFLGWAYLGMSLTAVLALWYRGSFLVGPAVCWAVFFGGATTVHLGEGGHSAPASHGHLLAVFATHGLVSLLLVAALLASGLLRRPAREP